MLWTYRVFQDKTNRYSIREVFYEQDGTIIGYGKTPVALAAASAEDLRQLVTWFHEAFDLPILSMETVDAQIAAPPHPATNSIAPRGASSACQRTN